jgi:hypothetical protein
MGKAFRRVSSSDTEMAGRKQECLVGQHMALWQEDMGTHPDFASCCVIWVKLLNLFLNFTFSEM